MKKRIRKHWLLAVALLANIALLVLQRQSGMNAMAFTGRSILNFLFMITPIFICIGLMDVWVEKDAMANLMGEKSGAKGAIISIVFGTVTAVPVYALLPVAGILLKKGSKISNVLLFLCSSASIRIPLLLLEASSLGWKFTFVRLMLNIGTVVAIAFIIDKVLTEKDKAAIYKNADGLGPT